MLEFLNIDHVGVFLTGVLIGIAAGWTMGVAFRKNEVMQVVDGRCEVPLERDGKGISFKQIILNGKPSSACCWYLNDVNSGTCNVTNKKCRYCQR